MEKTPLKVKKPLQAKSQLKAKVQLKGAPGGLKASRTVKAKKPSVTELKKTATKLFNKVIKYRDSQLVGGEKWVFECITCNKDVLYSYLDDGVWRFMRNAHAGHFQPETRGATRYNEINVNGQCGACNFNQGEQYRYAKALDLKYGTGTADELEKLAKESHPFTIEELEEIIHDAREQIKFYERMQNGEEER